MKLYQISSSNNFFLSLYEGIISRYEIDDLPKLNIFLPNRNSCYKLTQMFYQNLEEDRGVLMPKIMPIGEISEVSISSNVMEISAKSLPKPISFEEQTVLISHLIKNKLEEYDYSPHDIIKTAEQITKLIAKFRIDDIDLNNISKILNLDSAKHLALYYEIFNFITQIWPSHMQKNNVIDNVEYRNLFIKEIIKNNVLDCKNTIIAGSTGSILSTKRLIKHVLENGGFFIASTIGGYLTEEHWHNIDNFHPNFCLKNLFEYINYEESYIPTWHEEKKNKVNILSYFIGKDQISSWKKDQGQQNNIELIETSNLFEEAFAIAIKCQDIINTHPNNDILIMSGNMGLNHDLEKCLKILGLSYQNLKGKKISESDEYNFIENLSKICEERFSIKSLLSIMKSHYFLMGNSRQEVNNAVIKLEKGYLRRICSYNNLNDLIKNVQEQEIKELLQHFAETTKSLKNKYVYLDEYCRNLIDVIAKISTTKEKNNYFSSSDIGKQIIESIQEAQIFLKSKTKFYSKYIRLILLNSIKNKKIFEENNQTSSITISNPVDSRLDDADNIILADFNNTSWPSKESSDPWLNENIYNILGLNHEKLKNSLSSYDLASLLNKKNIIITRSRSVDGIKAMPSKWLERIRLFELYNQKIILLEDKKTLERVKCLHRTLNIIPLPPQEISPPIEMRPKELAVTQIEKLMRDPYSIYALKILSLKKLDDICRAPSQADFGNFIHSTIDLANKSNVEMEQFLEKFIEIGEKEIIKFGRQPIIFKIWWPRFLEIANWYAKFERSRRDKKVKIFSEVAGHIIIHNSDESFKLKAKADQIVIDGEYITIIDFKTGTLPTNKDITSGFSAQMTLESLIVIEKGFAINGTLKDAKYIQLSSGKNLGKIQEIKNIKDLALQAKDGVSKLINIYSTPNQPYLACPNPSKAPLYNDYDHLERIEKI